MSRMQSTLVLVVAFALAPEVARAACTDEGAVFVRAKTPVRRGPGLGYPVDQFLESGRCGGLEQVSMDGEWVLVRFGERFGWVQSGRLDAAGQELAAKNRVSSAPTSGLERAFSEMTERAVARERPQEGSPPRRVMPRGTRVLALRTTADRTWVEVRDDRGDVAWVPREAVTGGKLDELPALQPDLTEIDAPLEVEEPEVPSGAAMLARRRMGAVDEGVHLTAGVYGAAVAPAQSLGSNGEAAYRRYDIAALSSGFALDLQLTDLGPLTARAYWSMGFMSGLATDAEPDRAAAGTTSALAFRVGWPLRLLGGTFSPELGYALDVTGLDLALPGAVQPTFISTETHSGLAGVRYQLPFEQAFLLELDAMASLGGMSTSPGTLGDGGLALGGRGSVGLQYLFDAAFGLALRYQLEGWSASFSGASALDSTITEATVTELRHSILVGATYSL